MSKFEVKITQNRWGAQVFKIVDDNHNYLHSDGITLPCGEYWPTEEQAQAVLDKFKPKPKHEWVHGDVFKTKFGESVMVYLVLSKGPVVYIMEYSGPGEGSVDYCLKDATFLFNIKSAAKDWSDA